MPRRALPVPGQQASHLRIRLLPARAGLLPRAEPLLRAESDLLCLHELGPGWLLPFGLDLLRRPLL